MEVDVQDRHAVRAVLRASAEVIVTFKLRDFTSPALGLLNIRARHPSEFLLSLFLIEPPLVDRRINKINEAEKERVHWIYSKRLRWGVSAFVGHFVAAAGLMQDEV